MSIARHHAEWLSLVEISGPFLSMPVLMRAFPQGLDMVDTKVARNLRLAYEEWLTTMKRGDLTQQSTTRGYATFFRWRSSGFLMLSLKDPRYLRA